MPKLKYLHTMIRVTNLEKSLHFYCEGLGFKVLERQEYPKDKFTLVFIGTEGENKQSGPSLELTYNWGVEKYQRGDAYGHVAYEVDSIDDVQAQLKRSGYDLSWGPGETPSKSRRMAFVDDPDGFEIELIENRR